MDAVLPLLLRDLHRVELLLLPSLMRCYRDLGTLYVVVPRGDVAEVRERLAAAGLSFPFVVLAETSVVPERLLFGRWRKGWYVQQLIKLTMASRVAGAHYLSLDCDLVCTRPFGDADLAPGGRALLEVLPEGQSEEWYPWAERVLGLPAARRHMGVTPVVYSTAVVRALQEHLGTRATTLQRMAARLLPAGRSWRLFLMRNLPWTEMSLYVTYLEASGLEATEHEPRPAPALSGNNFWSREQFESWDPAKTLDPDAPFFFSVLASSSGVAVAEVITKIEAAFPSSP